MTSLGILDFINDSAVEAPSGLGRALARQLQQHLVSEYQDVLPRLVDPPSDDSAQNRRTIEEIGVQGKQSGVQFMVRGGLLAVSSEEVDGEAEVRVQLYAELINAESTRIQSFRARGIGRQPAPGFDLDGLLATADLRSSSFRKTALGKALSNAEYQDVLPRLVDPPSDDSAQNRRTIEEIGVQGKQSGVQFIEQLSDSISMASLPQQI